MRRQSTRASSPSGPAAPIPSPPPRDVETVFERDYEVVRKLGAGGFGTAFEVRHRNSGRLLVAKKAHKGEDESLFNEFVKSNSINHANVCQIHAILRDAKHGNVLVMEHGGKALDYIKEAVGLRRASEILS